jgi:UDP-N-acetylglucosamine 2-epimerase (non-hydrolysing)
LRYYGTKIEASDVMSRLSLAEDDYFLVSAHRQENVDSPARLRSLLDCLMAIRGHWGLRVIVSTHPRTRARLEALDNKGELSGVDFSEPFGFLDYNRLQMRAFCVLSDSGTISEESAILRFPAVTLRSSIERPEALDAGSIIMTDLSPDRVVAGIEAAREDYSKTSVPIDYRVADSSIRVRNFMLSTAMEHAVWSGLRSQ